MSPSNFLKKKNMGSFTETSLEMRNGIYILMCGNEAGTKKWYGQQGALHCRYE